MRTVTVIGAVPIPLGHRIEVTWYERDKSPGFFGGGAPTVERLDHPRIQDLDTGIVYLDAQLAHRLHPHGFQPGKVNTRAVGVPDDLRPAEVLVGKVTLCQLTAYSDDQVETWLEVEET